MKFGDILVTYGSLGMWPPRRWLLWIVYNGIYSYQKKKWGAVSDYKPTHVRMYAGDDLWFETTTPYCTYTKSEDLMLNKKKFKIVRYKDIDNLDKRLMHSVMDDLVGYPYDKGDLVDFFISGIIFSNFKNVIRILGDRSKKFSVCSTSLGEILKQGGMNINPITTDPAFFTNRLDLFKTIEEQ